MNSQTSNINYPYFFANYTKWFEIDGLITCKCLTFGFGREMYLFELKKKSAVFVFQRCTVACFWAFLSVPSFIRVADYESSNCVESTHLR